MTHLSYLTLNHMAAFLSTRFDRTIATTTPYWWWKVNKVGQLPVEMPEPVQTHGQSPMWKPDEIESWYGTYLDAIGEPYNVVKVKASSRRRSAKSRQSK